MKLYLNWNLNLTQIFCIFVTNNSLRKLKTCFEVTILNLCLFLTNSPSRKVKTWLFWNSFKIKMFWLERLLFNHLFAVPGSDHIDLELKGINTSVETFSWMNFVIETFYWSFAAINPPLHGIKRLIASPTTDRRLLRRNRVCAAPCRVLQFLRKFLVKFIVQTLKMPASREWESIKVGMI